MPTDYQCRRCDLRFSAGGYHHRLNKGYGSRALLVCTACGTQHALERATPMRDQLLAQQRLLYHAAPLREEHKPEWLIWSGSVPAERKELTCQHCQTTGNLVSDLDETAPCPSCKEKKLRIRAQWVT